ncbi:NUDIX domain-containing protein [Nesterenkonia halobia]|uniref:NUDIX domain-containing protein n=1 Tax=Nesterenkonia halobia TaxID=37922 RepID=A0ABP6R9M6_9MICC
MERVLTPDEDTQTAPAAGDAAPIRVSAVVIRNSDGEVLTVRKAGTDRFMLPGGKPEPGETPVQTAARECCEELDVQLWQEDLRRLGTFRAPAANEPDRDVEGVVFVHDAVPAGADHTPSAEIEELRWVDMTAEEPSTDLAPLLRDQIAPALQAEAAVA